MMLSPPIDGSPDTRYSCWLAAGSDRTLISALDGTATLPSIRSANVGSAPSHPREPASFELKRAHRPRRSYLSKPKPAAKSP